MPIIPFNELDKYIATISFEVGHESMNMLELFRDKGIAKERVIENITRKVEDAMDTIEESSNLNSSEDNYYLGE